MATIPDSRPSGSAQVAWRSKANCRYVSRDRLELALTYSARRRLSARNTFANTVPGFGGVLLRALPISEVRPQLRMFLNGGSARPLLPDGWVLPYGHTV